MVQKWLRSPKPNKSIRQIIDFADTVAVAWILLQIQLFSIEGRAVRDSLFVYPIKQWGWRGIKLGLELFLERSGSRNEHRSEYPRTWLQDA